MKLIVIGGPTASGKTNLAVQIAKKFNGELINADSRQVYRYLDIGTNKENVDVPIHLISFLNPDQQFNVFEYKKLAEEKIQEITSRGKLPILVGGTGLYIDAVIKNYELRIKNEELDPELRKSLEVKSINELQDLATEQSPKAFNELNNSDRNNPRRLIRLIEKSMNNQSAINNSKFEIQKYEVLFLYPDCNWEELKNKIDRRVEVMFKEGIIEETQKVLDMGFPKTSIALQGIGYREVLDYLEGKIELEKCIELVKTSHRQYAKRQKTWFEGEGRNYNLIKVKDINPASDHLQSLLNP